MNKWTKFYLNGSVYVGTDEEVAAQKASWTRSSNENMIAAELEHNGNILRIEGLGEYWQSDTYRYSIMTGKQKLIKRRIERQIKSGDGRFQTDRSLNRFLVVFYDSNQLYGNWQISCAKEKQKMISHNGIRQSIWGGWKDKWLVAEYDLEENKTYHYLSDVKV